MAPVLPGALRATSRSRDWLATELPRAARAQAAAISVPTRSVETSNHAADMTDSEKDDTNSIDLTRDALARTYKLLRNSDRVLEQLKEGPCAAPESGMAGEDLESAE